MRVGWGGGVDNVDRKFNVASHMGHVSCVLFVNFKVRALLHMKVCKAGDMCSHHKVGVYLCFIFRGGGREVGVARRRTGAPQV